MGGVRRIESASVCWVATEGVRVNINKGLESERTVWINLVYLFY